MVICFYMYKISLLMKVYLYCILYILILVVEAKQDSCMNNIYHVNHFKLTHADFTDSLQPCTTVLIPRRKHKLLLNLTKVSLLDEDLLEIKTDIDLYVFQGKCQKCLEGVISKKVHVRFYRKSPFRCSKPKKHNFIFHKCSQSTFRLDLKSFNPIKCEVPKSPLNGYFIGKNRSIGAQIKFQCHPNYSLIGSTNATCVQQPKLGIPYWSEHSSSCVLKCMSDSRLLERNEGIISRSNAKDDCNWLISRPYDSVVEIRARYMSLSFSEAINTTFKSGNFIYTSKSLFTLSKVYLLPLQFVYLGSNVNTFLLEYKVIKLCPPIYVDNSNVMFSSHSNISLPGMSVLIECLEHYKLVGESVLKCLDNGKWSSPLPICLYSSNYSEKILKRFPRIVKRNQNGVDASKSKRPSYSKIQLDVKEKKEDLNDSSTNLELLINSTTSELTDVNSISSKLPVQSITSPMPTILYITTSSNKSNNSSVMNTTEIMYHPLMTGDSDVNVNDSFLVQIETSHSTPLNKTQTEYKKIETHFNKSQQEELDDLLIEFEGDDTDINEAWFDWTEMEILGLNIVFFGLVLMISVVLIVTLIVIVTFLLYRKKYPVRLGLGRSFDTFENPIYSRVHMRSPVKCSPGASQVNTMESTDKEQSSHGESNPSPALSKT